MLVRISYSQDPAPSFFLSLTVTHNPPELAVGGGVPYSITDRAAIYKHPQVGAPRGDKKYGHTSGVRVWRWEPS